MGRRMFAVLDPKIANNLMYLALEDIMALYRGDRMRSRRKLPALGGRKPGF